MAPGADLRSDQVPKPVGCRGDDVGALAERQRTGWGFPQLPLTNVTGNTDWNDTPTVKARLTGGFCMRAPAQGACPYADICESFAPASASMPPTCQSWRRFTPKRQYSPPLPRPAAGSMKQPASPAPGPSRVHHPNSGGRMNHTPLERVEQACTELIQVGEDRYLHCRRRTTAGDRDLDRDQVPPSTSTS